MATQKKKRCARGTRRNPKSKTCERLATVQTRKKRAQLARLQNRIVAHPERKSLQDKRQKLVAELKQM